MAPHVHFVPRRGNFKVGPAGFAQGTVPAGGDDGSGLRLDRRDHVLRLRLRAGQGVRREDGHHFQALLGATLRPGTLRFARPAFAIWREK